MLWHLHQTTVAWAGRRVEHCSAMADARGERPTADAAAVVFAEQPDHPVRTG